MARSPRSFVLALLLPGALLGAACLGGDPTPPPSDPAGSPQLPPATTDPATDSPSPRDPGPQATEPQGTGAGLAAETEPGDAPGEENQAAAAAALDRGPERRDPDPADREAPESTAKEPPPTPLEVMIFVQPAQVRPGQVFLVAIDTRNASAASVALDGQFISLAREGDRFYTILPVPFETPPGRLNMVVAVADLSGELAVQKLLAVEVLPAESLVELVEIDATLSRLLDPAVVAEDRAIRDAVQRVRSPLRFWQGLLPAADGGRDHLRLRPAALLQRRRAHRISQRPGLRRSARRRRAGRQRRRRRLDRRDRAPRTRRDHLHGGGVFSSYWHLSSVATEPGTPVPAGTLIGRVGTTGLSTGAHLHWEISVYGVRVDPLPWLRELEVPNPLAAFDPARAVNQVAADTADP